MNAVYISLESYIAGGGFVAGMLLEIVVLFFFLRMMYDAGALAENHRQEEVPVGAGISFPATLFLIFSAYAILERVWQWPVFPPAYLAYLLGITVLAMLGFIDDMLGSREGYGLLNNLGSLVHGRLGTGGLKILGACAASFLVAFLISPEWLDCVINTFLIFSMISIMNWLDLQPRRAIKGFALFLAAIILIALGSVDYMLMAPLAGVVFTYFFYDMRARALMGDAGASVLGFSLGFWAASSLSLSARVAVLLCLIVVQFMTERFAISSINEERSLFSRINDGSL